MAKIDHEKVTEAVHACLEQCYEKPAEILPALAGFIERLEDGVGWNEDEIRLVEEGVRKVLVFGVLDSTRYRGDAPNSPADDNPLRG